MKIALITGANSGLGYASTQALLNEGYYIYMACRSEAKAVEAINSFDLEFRDKVEYVHCDLSSFCLLYTSPSPRDATLSRMPSSA